MRFVMPHVVTAQLFRLFGRFTRFSEAPSPWARRSARRLPPWLPPQRLRMGRRAPRSSASSRSPYIQQPTFAFELFRRCQKSDWGVLQALSDAFVQFSGQTKRLPTRIRNSPVAGGWGHQPLFSILNTFVKSAPCGRERI
eukprot:15449290-Alexandrium_andersonii.AAC.1